MRGRSSEQFDNMFVTLMSYGGAARRRVYDGKSSVKKIGMTLGAASSNPAGSAKLSG